MLKFRLSTHLILLTISGCERAVVVTCQPDGADVTPMVASAPSRWTDPPAMSELWRVGGTRDSEILSSPISVSVSPTGNAAIPDFGLSEVLVVGPGGEWLGSWSASGLGPLEVRLPIASTWAQDGSLLVWDLSGSKTVRYTQARGLTERAVDRDFSMILMASGELLWASMASDGSIAFKVRDAERSVDGSYYGREHILKLTEGATAPDTLASASFRTLADPYRSHLIPGTSGIVAGMSASGAIALSDSTAVYAIQLYPASGEGLLICRDVEALPFTAEERGQTVDPSLLDLSLAIQSAPDVPSSLIGRLFFDAEDRLWVQRDRPNPMDPNSWGLGVEGAEHDVFSAGGEYLGSIVAPPRARIQSALGDTIWTLEIGEFDESWLVAYTLDGR